MCRCVGVRVCVCVCVYVCKRALGEKGEHPRQRQTEGAFVHNVC